VKKIPTNRIVLATVIAVVLVVLAVGLLLSGSPAVARLHLLDAARVAELRAIGRSVDLYWTRSRRLPATLDELSTEGQPYLRQRDPESGEPYEFRVLSDSTYEVCARFGKESQGPTGDFWAHGSGRCCFILKVREVEAKAMPATEPSPQR
jgi:hypothetical protein